MALPPGFLDELRNRLTLSDVVGRKVVWDRRKSSPGKGDFWAPCPFHQERTPSFHVDDRKGFYYCFGCHAKGDLITFVKEVENLSFIEAVERLAGDAGLEMPRERADPRAAERRDRLTRLGEVMEEAVRLFGRALRSGAGARAREYVARRGLSAEVQARFDIGFAPDSRTHLSGHFRQQGRLDEAVEAGLVIRPEDGSAPYDRFRDRLMFPIRDPRGRCIAFGGRALSPEARAKYLNSPETPLFSKGRILFNEGPAREAAGKTGRLIVAEGYMDVIALTSAGIEDAVAPLGTAITGEQLERLWRMAPEPVLALDGDEAGLRAARSLMDLALPVLAPGRSLQFCLLPEGRDPDDLVRSGGRAAVETVLDAAVPLVEMLWRRETEEHPLDTPERRAALDARLRATLGRIADPGVRNHYAAELRTRRAGLFRPQGFGGRVAAGQGARPGGHRGLGFRRLPEGPAADTRNSPLARGDGGDAAARGREAAILLIALRNPEAAGRLESELDEMPVSTPAFQPLREALVQALAAGEPVEPACCARLGRDAASLLSAVPQARAHPMAEPGRPVDRVAALLTEAIARHVATVGFRREADEAARDLPEAAGEDWTWRMRQAGLARLQHDTAAVKESETDDPSGPSAIERMLHEARTRGKKRRTPPSNR